MEILNDVSSGIARITFNRPEKKNAITAAMYQAMADAIAGAEADASVRAMLIVGHADIFTAGNDLEDFLKNPPSGDASPVFRFLWNISHAAKPIVAAVRGPAVGIGTTLLMHCDLVYAGDNARFSMPFTQLALVPEAASSLLFPRLAGYARAAEKLLLGDAFDAAEALNLGLVSKVLPATEVVAFAEKQAARLVALPAAAVRSTKRLMKSDVTPLVEQRMATEGEQFRLMLQSPEAREAFTAFFERRKADFSKFD